jgi:hypothetical protein
VTADQKARLECFRVARVPVQSLIDFLEGGEAIDQSLALQPAITRGQVVAVLLDDFWRTHSVTVGKITWTRDDLHNR